MNHSYKSSAEHNGNPRTRQKRLEEYASTAPLVRRLASIGKMPSSPAHGGSGSGNVIMKNAGTAGLQAKAMKGAMPREVRANSKYSGQSSRHKRRKRQPPQESALDIGKKRLLQQQDWVGLAASRPLQMSFSSRHDKDQIGKRRKHNKARRATKENEGHLAPHVLAPNSEYRVYNGGPFMNGALLPAPETISVRIGNDMLASQVTAVPMTQQAVVALRRMEVDRESSDIMLFDEEQEQHEHDDENRAEYRLIEVQNDINENAGGRVQDHWNGNTVQQSPFQEGNIQAPFHSKTLEMVYEIDAIPLDNAPGDYTNQAGIVQLLDDLSGHPATPQQPRSLEYDVGQHKNIVNRRSPPVKQEKIESPARFWFRTPTPERAREFPGEDAPRMIIDISSDESSSDDDSTPVLFHKALLVDRSSPQRFRFSELEDFGDSMDERQSNHQEKLAANQRQAHAVKGIEEIVAKETENENATPDTDWRALLSLSNSDLEDSEKELGTHEEGQHDQQSERSKQRSPSPMRANRDNLALGTLSVPLEPKESSSEYPEGLKFATDCGKQEKKLPETDDENELWRKFVFVDDDDATVTSEMPGEKHTTIRQPAWPAASSLFVWGGGSSSSAFSQPVASSVALSRDYAADATSYLRDRSDPRIASSLYGNPTASDAPPGFRNGPRPKDWGLSYTRSKPTIDGTTASVTAASMFNNASQPASVSASGETEQPSSALHPCRPHLHYSSQHLGNEDDIESLRKLHPRSRPRRNNKHTQREDSLPAPVKLKSARPAQFSQQADSSHAHAQSLARLRSGPKGIGAAGAAATGKRPARERRSANILSLGPAIYDLPRSSESDDGRED